MDTEHDVQLGRTEAHMLRWVSGFTLERKENECRDQRIVGTVTSQLDCQER